MRVKCAWPRAVSVRNYWRLRCGSGNTFVPTAAGSQPGDTNTGIAVSRQGGGCHPPFLDHKSLGVCPGQNCHNANAPWPVTILVLTLVGVCRSRLPSRIS